MNPDPQHLDDQTGAALAEVAANLDAIASDADSTPVSADAWPDWVRAGALTAYQTWATGVAYLCEHRPTLAAPRPVHASALLPGVTVCGACLSMLRLPDNDPRDRTCFGCGHIVTWREECPDDRLFVGIAAVGVLTWYYSACGACKFWGADPAAVTA